MKKLARLTSRLNLKNFSFKKKNCKISGKMKLGKTRHTIKKQMIISYFLCVAIPLIVVNIFSSLNSRRTLKETSSQLATAMTKQTCTNISTYADEIEKLANRIIVNELNASAYNLVNEYMSISKKGSEKALAKHKIEEDIENQLLYSLALDDSINEIGLVFNEDNNVVTTYDSSAKGEDLKDEELVKFSEYNPSSSIQWLTDLPGYENRIFVFRQLNNVKREKQ